MSETSLSCSSDCCIDGTGATVLLFVRDGTPSCCRCATAEAATIESNNSFCSLEYTETGGKNDVGEGDGDNATLLVDVDEEHEGLRSDLDSALLDANDETAAAAF